MFRRGRGDETILLRMKPFSPLRADVPKRSLTINLPNEAPPSGEYWEPVMQNVVAINAAAREGIIAAQATSDEMLLESIAEGGRTAMHTLYSRHNVRVYRFVLRMVRDTTMAEDLVSQVFLDVWRGLPPWWCRAPCEARNGKPAHCGASRGYASRSGRLRQCSPAAFRPRSPGRR